MSYTPLYTSLDKVESITRVSFTQSSVPTRADVLSWVEQIESRVEARALGSHTATDQYIDVPMAEEIYPDYTWYYEVEDAKLRFEVEGGVVVPLGGVKYPIISVTSLYKNDEDYDSTPDWEQLTEWDGSSDDTDFMLLTTGRRDSGYALWFYDDEPEPGPKRLKATYTYGYNIDADILDDWCGLYTSIKVLTARMGSNEDSGLSMLEGGDLGVHINTNYKDRIEELRRQIVEIEIEYFPLRRAEDDDLAMEVL